MKHDFRGLCRRRGLWLGIRLVGEGGDGGYMTDDIAAFIEDR
jgi:hypothetical protein